MVKLFLLWAGVIAYYSIENNGLNHLQKFKICG